MPIVRTLQAVVHKMCYVYIFINDKLVYSRLSLNNYINNTYINKTTNVQDVYHVPYHCDDSCLHLSSGRLLRFRHLQLWHVQ